MKVKPILMMIASLALFISGALLYPVDKDWEEVKN